MPRSKEFDLTFKTEICKIKETLIDIIEKQHLKENLKDM